MLDTTPASFVKKYRILQALSISISIVTD